MYGIQIIYPVLPRGDGGCRDKNMWYCPTTQLDGGTTLEVPTRDVQQQNVNSILYVPPPPPEAV
jgi:hypothetical protein